MTKLCLCGCGEPTNRRGNYLHGHWSRTPEAKAMKVKARSRELAPPNPSGLCQCGCEERAPVAKRTDSRKGWIAGESVRFLPGHHARDMKGAKAARWKGGRLLATNGYVLVYKPEHRFADAKGYIGEHRVVAEAARSQPLEAGEVVHHINGVRTDNRPENLVVMTQAQHAAEHTDAFLERTRRWRAENPASDAEIRRQGGYAAQRLRRRKEWMAARKRLGWWYRNRSPQTIDELVEAVLGSCPPEPEPLLWRHGGMGSPLKVRIDPFREEWLAARDRVTALWSITAPGDIHWDQVVEAVLGPRPPATSAG